jgi:hypothetical protein
MPLAQLRPQTLQNSDDIIHNKEIPPAAKVGNEEAEEA